MILDRLVAFAESKQILAIHLLATPFLALQGAVMAMVPVLLRSHFRASEWQTTVSTAAIPIMLMLSVLWNELYRRTSPRAYLWLLWVVAIGPLAGIALCHRVETVLIFVVLSAAGFGAIAPITADIMRSCYPPPVRSKVFGALQAITQSTVMVAVYAIGVWLDLDSEAYRLYLPAGVLLIGVGMCMLYRITRHRLFQERLKHNPTEPFLLSLRNAYGNMAAVLRGDRDFRRYEIAFFIYGLAWMICWALLPFLVVDKLHLPYTHVARSTQTAYQMALLLAVLPIGYLMDRLGPIRTSGCAFAILTLYPVGLILSTGVNSLTLVTIGYGIAMGGVHLAWTIGPVTLAKDASQAPQYLAIHATMVGFRAILGQFPAVALYKLTGDIRIPLAAAVVLFPIGALAMNRLGRDQRLARRAVAPAVPLPPDQMEVA